MQTLQQLLQIDGKHYPKIGALLTHPIPALCLDSRLVTPNCLFLATKGAEKDGREFIPEAIAKGASLILCETEQEDAHLTWRFIDNTPCIAYFRLSENLSRLASGFYHAPSAHLTLIGVTGTNGKTTISQLFAQWVGLLGGKSAVMGTMGNGFLGQLHTTKNTTPSPLAIQQQLAEYLHQGATHCAMEVSSHGLHQHRVDGLTFQGGIFTNLSRDHLDYHRTMENYANAKKRLFHDFDYPHKIINADDNVGQAWLRDFPEAVAVSCNPHYHPHHKKWLKATQVAFCSQGTKIYVDSSWGKGVLRSALIGQFNVANLLETCAMLLSLGYPMQALCDTAPYLQGVFGRMQTLNTDRSPTAIVDYAHTPDALQKALEASRLHCQGELWCVFGCGGDRDRGKRPLMGEIASRFADHLILTDDNPRTENPEQIMGDIKEGIPCHTPYLCIHNRKDAIEYALSHAKVGDIVLVAGKGHENYQIIGQKTVHFSDQEVIQQYQNKHYD